MNTFKNMFLGTLVAILAGSALATPAQLAHELGQDPCKDEVVAFMSGIAAMKPGSELRLYGAHKAEFGRYYGVDVTRPEGTSLSNGFLVEFYMDQSCDLMFEENISVGVP